MKFLETRRIALAYEGTGTWGDPKRRIDDTLIPCLVNPAMIISAEPAANPRHTALRMIEHNSVMIIDMPYRELNVWLQGQ